MAWHGVPMVWKGCLRQRRSSVVDETSSAAQAFQGCGTEWLRTAASEAVENSSQYSRALVLLKLWETAVITAEHWYFWSCGKQQSLQQSTGTSEAVGNSSYCNIALTLLKLWKTVVITIYIYSFDTCESIEFLKSKCSFWSCGKQQSVQHSFNTCESIEFLKSE